MIEFSYEPFEFEFYPGNSYTEGELDVTRDGSEPYGAKIDLASGRGRTSWAAKAHELYPEIFDNPTELERGLAQLYTFVKETERIAEAKRAEEEQEAGGDPVIEPEAGTETYEQALALLSSKDVLAEVVEDMSKLGHVGDDANKKLAFTCGVSARAQLPVQPSTHASSSSGKSFLWDTALSLMPPELVYKRTGFSAKALFRTSMSLKHSVLYIQEVAGTEGADFSIRTLQSDNVLKWEATEKQPDGSLKNVEYEIEGPTVIVQTTTKNHLHPENETRVVPLYLDESESQTERITQEVLKRAAGIDNVSQEEREAICAKWQDAIRLLSPVEVTIPYAQRIQVPSAPVRLRRDVPRLLNIVRLIAWMHQYTRNRDEQGRVIATESDFEKALELVGSSFARAWKKVSPSEEKVLEACRELPEKRRKHGFQRSHVEKQLKEKRERVPANTVRDCLRTLSYSGYLESDGRKGAQGATYTLSESIEMAGTISLADAPSVNSSINQVSPANEQLLIDEAQSVNSRQSSIDGSDEKCRNDVRQLKTSGLQGKDANCRTDEESDETGKEEGDNGYVG